MLEKPGAQGQVSGLSVPGPLPCRGRGRGTARNVAAWMERAELWTDLPTGQAHFPVGSVPGSEPGASAQAEPTTCLGRRQQSLGSRTANPWGRAASHTGERDGDDRGWRGGRGAEGVQGNTTSECLSIKVPAMPGEVPAAALPQQLSPTYLSLCEPGTWWANRACEPALSGSCSSGIGWQHEGLSLWEWPG